MKTSDDCHKKVLIIAYHFPPDTSIGALRPQKFVKYLPEFGWHPYVLTINEKYLPGRDQGKMKDVVHATIFRTSYLHNPLHALCRIFKKNGKPPVQAEITPDKQQPAAGSYVKPTVRERIKRFVLDLANFPDDNRYWLLTAVPAGLYMIFKHRIRHIYSTSPPHSVDIVGYLLAKLSGATLIVDHRDPWAIGNDRKEHPLFVRLQNYLEHKVFRQAAWILTTTDNYTGLLKTLCPDVKDKIVTITNGYDPDDLPPQPTGPAGDKFRMVYAGQFYLGRSPVGLIRALAELTRSYPGFGNDLELVLVGTQRHVGDISLEGLVESQELKDRVRFVNQVPYHEALSYMIESDVLLLFAPNFFYQIPAKTFDYLACRRPILAFAEEGATEDLIEKYKAGLTVRQDDIAGIKAAVKILYDRRNSVDVQIQAQDLSCFERRNLTRSLVTRLEQPVANE